MGRNMEQTNEALNTQQRMKLKQAMRRNKAKIQMGRKRSMRKLASKERGLCRGWAIANYIEVTSGIPRERAELRVCRDGKIELVVGTMSSGQGHETSYAQVVSDWLGVPFDSVRFIANDTDRVTVGGGSHSGRSMRLVSIAIGEAVKDLIDKGKAFVANILSTSELSITYENSYFLGPNEQRLSLLDVE